jgi:hypothetical protein
MAHSATAFVMCVAMLVAGLAGCGEADTPKVGLGGPLELTVVGWSATCDSCTTLTVRGTGRGLQEVVAAEIVAQDADRTSLGAFTSLHMVTDADEPELHVAATFRDVPVPGAYDLLLRTDRAGEDSVVRIRDALKVTPASPGGAVQVQVRASGATVCQRLRPANHPESCPPGAPR